MSSRSESVDDSLIPVRMLNEFTYCPRLGYLEWVQGEWAENIETLEGTFGHRNVDHADRRSFDGPGGAGLEVSGEGEKDERGETRARLLTLNAQPSTLNLPFPSINHQP